MNINKLFLTLRESSSEPHKQLEATYPFCYQMRSEAFSPLHYGRALSVLRAFHIYAAPLVARLPDEIRHLIIVDDVIDALNRDLQILGVQKEQPEFKSALSSQSPTSLLAFSYVWMGSSMGGSIISRWLQSRHPGLPQQYYRAMAETGANWETFKAGATDWAGANNINEDDAGDAARQVFESIINTASHYSEPA